MSGPGQGPGGYPGPHAGVPHGISVGAGAGGGGGSPDPNASGGADQREVKTPPGGRPSGAGHSMGTGRSRPSQSPIKRHKDTGQ